MVEVLPGYSILALGRFPYLVFSCIEQVVQLWRDDLRKINPKAAEALADPSQYANLFPNMAEALQAETMQVNKHCLWFC
jgi:coatomer subunit beta'